MTPSEVQKELERVLRELPPDIELNSVGIYYKSKRKTPKRDLETPKRIVIDEIVKALEWLKYISPSKAMRTKSSSYGYKHHAEAFAKHRHANSYISNGAFIAAALILGFRYRLGHEPNCSFNFSQKSVGAFTENSGKIHTPEYMDDWIGKQFLKKLEE